MRSERIIPARPGVWLLVFALTILCGCGSDELNSPTAVKLRALGNFYLEHAAGKQGRGPANEQAFKKHLRNAPDFILQNYGLDAKSIDSAFVSERDQEPFVVLYGITIGGISGHSGPLVAHEKTGRHGKRLAGFANGKVALIDEARLQELTTANK